MKKLFQKLGFVAVAASMALLYSCTGDEEQFAIPTISFDPVSGQTIDVGAELDVVVTVVAEGGFNVLRASLGTESIEFTRNDTDFVTLNEDNTQASVTFSFSAASVGEYTVDFEAVDDESQVATASFIYNAISPTAKVQTAVMLFAPSQDSLTNTFYSIENNMTYSVADINGTTDPLSASIDLGYFYGQEANLVSPSDYVRLTGLYSDPIGVWGSTNSTSMVELTGVDVTEISTVADVEAAIADVDFANDGAVTIEGVTANDLYAFSSGTGYSGLIRVVSILEGYQVGADPNDPIVTGNIELEFILTTAE